MSSHLNFFELEAAKDRGLGPMQIVDRMNKAAAEAAEAGDHEKAARILMMLAKLLGYVS